MVHEAGVVAFGPGVDDAVLRAAEEEEKGGGGGNISLLELLLQQPSNTFGSPDGTEAPGWSKLAKPRARKLQPVQAFYYDPPTDNDSQSVRQKTAVIPT